MNYPLATLFERFLKERTYLKNVTPRTLVRKAARVGTAPSPRSTEV